MYELPINISNKIVYINTKKLNNIFTIEIFRERKYIFFKPNLNNKWVGQTGPGWPMGMGLMIWSGPRKLNLNGLKAGLKNGVRP